ncbi:MAG: hypothetical protein FJ276_35815 [Planctomycetes bacterium]|nr:hypothetical protein [Planctomycetota bacterium]
MDANAREATPGLSLSAAQRKAAGQLDPAGKRHIPIGVPNSLDSLKTFVEAEGCFSPGIGSYGIYYWVYDRDEHTLTAPTMKDVACTCGLAESRYLIPWAQWSAGRLAVRTQVCEVNRQSPHGEVFVVGSSAGVTNTGDCSGALRFDLSIPAGGTETIQLICPVLPGRRAVRHRWVPRTNNFIDSAIPRSDAGGIDQPDPGSDYYRTSKAEDLFAQARAFWDNMYSRVTFQLPDARWTDGLYVMLAHAGLCMNENAPDVAVLNYPVFNRDGMYVANMMLKGGFAELSEAVIDYFLAHSKEEPDQNRAVAMPHGWAIAEVWLLMRDCLVFEDRGRLILLSGVDPSWLTHADGVTVKNLPSYYGPLDLEWRPGPDGCVLAIGGRAKPPQGFVLRLPAQADAIVAIERKTVAAASGGDYELPPGTKNVRISLVKSMTR